MVLTAEYHACTVVYSKVVIGVLQVFIYTLWELRGEFEFVHVGCIHRLFKKEHRRLMKRMIGCRYDPLRVYLTMAGAHRLSRVVFNSKSLRILKYLAALTFDRFCKRE